MQILLIWCRGGIEARGIPPPQPQQLTGDSQPCAYYACVIERELIVKRGGGDCCSLTVIFSLSHRFPLSRPFTICKICREVKFHRISQKCWCLPISSADILEINPLESSLNYQNNSFNNKTPTTTCTGRCIILFV